MRRSQIIFLAVLAVWMVPTIGLGYAAWMQDTDVIPVRAMFGAWLIVSGAILIPFGYILRK